MVLKGRVGIGIWETKGKKSPDKQKGERERRWVGGVCVTEGDRSGEAQALGREK